MKTQNGFTLFDNLSEFKTWLKAQKITRKITKLQVHHMASPDYSLWNTTDKKYFGDNRELGRTLSLDTYGKNKWKSNDGYGHYIAQHFNIFPNGKITTGRNLNSTPIGITNWNTNAICIEIYGNFDVDVMTKEQKEAVIGIYAILSDHLNIPINSTYIRPHCWFTSGSGAIYLGNYVPSRSAKSCPGTKFMGFGNTKSAFENNFYPLVKAFDVNKLVQVSTTPSISIPIENVVDVEDFLIRVATETLNVRKSPNASSDIITTIKEGGVYTVIATNSNGTWGELKSGGWISLNYVEKYTTPNTVTEVKKTQYLRVLVDELNLHKTPDLNSSSVCGTIKKGEVYTIAELDNGLYKLKSGVYVTANEKYVEIFEG